MRMMEILRKTERLITRPHQEKRVVQRRNIVFPPSLSTTFHTEYNMLILLGFKVGYDD